MIRLKKVTKIYPDGTEAVRDVSFGVKKGELCVLLGPSGCGKTTTMKLINRLIPVTSGQVFIDGLDNAGMDATELRRNIGYAIQDVGLFPHMTVGDNIGTVPALKGWAKTERRKRAKELLELLRMNPDDFIDRYPRELSGGQRQRVGVARALGADPPILLMDEPFGAIDPITRVELQDEFLKIQQEIQKTIIFVTHDIYEAIKMADKIALMKSGQLIQYGSPAGLLHKPKDAFVADFVGADRALKGLQLIRARDVMWDAPPTARMNETTEAVRERMKAKGINWLAIVDDGGRFLGWVVESDLEKGPGLKDVVKTSQITTTANAVLSEVLSLMLTTDLDLLIMAVVDKQNRLEGVLTFDAIKEALSRAVDEESPHER